MYRSRGVAVARQRLNDYLSVADKKDWHPGGTVGAVNPSRAAEVVKSTPLVTLTDLDLADKY